MKRQSFIEIYKIQENFLLGMANDDWVISSDEIKNLNEINPSSLLSLLERQKEFKETIEKALSENRMSKRLKENFPIEKVLSIAFQMQSDYWTNLALDWIKDNPVSQKIIDELLLIQIEKWASQNTRHKAKKIYNDKKKG